VVERAGAGRRVVVGAGGRALQHRQLGPRPGDPLPQLGPPPVQHRLSPAGELAFDPGRLLVAVPTFLATGSR